jgi:hypothetical protein
MRDSRLGAGEGWGLARLHWRQKPSLPLRTALHTPPQGGNFSCNRILPITHSVVSNKFRDAKDPPNADALKIGS